MRFELAGAVGRHMRACGFNPTLVRFEHVCGGKPPGFCFSFNPTLVRFELGRALNDPAQGMSFNPTLVRFELSRVRARTCRTEFQSHIGAI